MLTLETIHSLAAQFGSAAAAPVREFEIGGRPFAFNREPAIMGVINLSPDSWYRESVCLSVERAVQRGRVLREQGAHLIDLGAESTLQHAQRLEEIHQRSKLLPVLRQLVQANLIVSVETYLPDVARAALTAGAQVINLTGPQHAQSIYRAAAEHDAAVIICYVQGPTVREVGDFDLRDDPIPQMHDFFSQQIELATRAGAHKLLLDPGLGFYYRNLQDSATRIRHQLRAFLHGFRLRILGFPLCNALPHAFEFFGEEVRVAEPFFAVIAALGKTNVYRTHEVSRIKAVLETLALY